VARLCTRSLHSPRLYAQCDSGSSLAGYICQFHLSFTIVMSSQNDTEQLHEITVKSEIHFVSLIIPLPLSSTWPYLNSDVGLEEGEY